jgi:hypothetical protein
VSGTGIVDVLREVQIPLLAVLLVCGAAAKAAHTIGARSREAETGPTMIFPLRLRRTTAVALCAAEFVLGFGLLLTAGRTGAGVPALVVRAATVLLFSTAVGALHVLRDRQPEAGCGCFGELSHTPVSLRTIARTAVLCVAALSSIGAPPLRMPGSAGQAGLTLAVIAAEVAALVALSPEAGEILARMSHADPCELREIPLARTFSVLEASAPWRPPGRWTCGGRDAGASWSSPACSAAGASRWYSPSTWPAGGLPSASECSTWARASPRYGTRPRRIRYRNLTAYTKKPIQPNKRDIRLSLDWLRPEELAEVRDSERDQAAFRTVDQTLLDQAVPGRREA